MQSLRFSKLTDLFDQHKSTGVVFIGKKIYQRSLMRDENGKVIWDKSDADRMYCRTVVTPKFIFTNTRSDTFYVEDAETGKIVANLECEQIDVFGNSVMAISDDDRLSFYVNGKFKKPSHYIPVESDDVKWTGSYNNKMLLFMISGELQVLENDVHQIHKLDCSEIVSLVDNCLIGKSRKDYDLLIYDLDTMKVIFSVDACMFSGGERRVAFKEGYLVKADYKGNIDCSSIALNKVVWTFNTRTHVETVRINNGRLFYQNRNGDVGVLDLASGIVIEEFRTLDVNADLENKFSPFSFRLKNESVQVLDQSIETDDEFAGERCFETVPLSDLSPLVKYWRPFPTFDYRWSGNECTVLIKNPRYLRAYPLKQFAKIEECVQHYRSFLPEFTSGSVSTSRMEFYVDEDTKIIYPLIGHVDFDEYELSLRLRHRSGKRANLRFLGYVEVYVFGYCKEMYQPAPYTLGCKLDMHDQIERLKQLRERYPDDIVLSFIDGEPNYGVVFKTSNTSLRLF